MAFTDTPKLGVDLGAVTLKADIDSGASNGRSHRLGEEVFATDGKRYVYGQAAAAISASTTACDVDTSDFTVAATGGSYKSPATAMATGDRGWFGAASV